MNAMNVTTATNSVGTMDIIAYRATPAKFSTWHERSQIYSRLYLCVQAWAGIYKENEKCFNFTPTLLVQGMARSKKSATDEVQAGAKRKRGGGAMAMADKTAVAVKAADRSKKKQKTPDLSDELSGAGDSSSSSSSNDDADENELLVKNKELGDEEKTLESVEKRLNETKNKTKARLEELRVARNAWPSDNIVCIFFNYIVIGL
jgi:hypothetical protein